MQFAANKLSGSSTTTNQDRLSHTSPSSSNRSSFLVTTAPAIIFNPSTILNRNDLDSVDVAVRIAMVNFFNSQEVLANFVEHTRTIRLYPRPVVSFQKSSFIQSRAKISPFLLRLVDTQAVEYLAEWTLCPDNVAFQRIQTGVFDPAIIGDKPKWYEKQLETLEYQIHEDTSREFYEEITSIIRDSSCMGSGATSNMSKFNHYCDEKLGANSSDIDENNNLVGMQQENESFGSYDINVIEDTASQSSYVSSNIPSSSELHIFSNNSNLNDRQSTDGRALSLNDIVTNQIRRMSLSSSDSNSGGWENHDKMLQTIPANYHHDIERYPPIRCDIQKYYKPCDRIIDSLVEARKWIGQTTATITMVNQNIDDSENNATDLDRRSSCDSSAIEGNDEIMKNMPDSSSCDESGTEEFNFDSIHPIKTDETSDALNETDDVEVRMFESVDSDTVIASNSVADISNPKSSDENNNLTDSNNEHTFDEVGSFEESLSNNMDNQDVTEQNSGIVRENKCSQQAPSITNSSSKSDAVSMIISSQKSRVSNGVAKLIDRASSITESKFLKQNSQSSTGPALSPLPRNLGGEQVGAFFDRFTSEARGAVKEARAAIDASKVALKTTAIPVADAGRQKLMKNLQNLGENLFEDRRDSLNLGNGAQNKLSGDEEAKQQQSVDRSDQPKQPLPGQSSTNKTGGDFNDIAGRANSAITGWLGSKATALSNRMRDKNRVFGPFPTSKYKMNIY